MGREAQRVVETYDRRREVERDCRRRARGRRRHRGGWAPVRSGSATWCGVATTAAADVTGILAASVLAAVGLAGDPGQAAPRARRNALKGDGLRARLGEALRSEFQAAQERGAQRLADGLAPYARFVRAEQERWDNVRAMLTAWRGRAANLTTAVKRDRGATRNPEPTTGTA